MKRIFRRRFMPFAIGAGVRLALAVGCANPAPRNANGPTMAIALSTPGAPPSPAQLASINQLLLGQIMARGFSVAKDAASADYVMRVRFRPDALNPPGGHLEFIGIERNPGRTNRGADNSAVE